MFYVIAAAAPEGSNAQTEVDIANQIRNATPLLQEQNPRFQSTIYPFSIEKSQFKIGSLDLLMQLNETTARIDGQLDSVCKRIEKIEHDTRGDNEQEHLMYRPNYTGPGTPYLDYIRTFKWDNMKFQTKRSLNELTIGIQKSMVQKDEAIRKHMEEFNLMKTQIAAGQKKDTGSLQVRDFTDDIYTKNVPAELFVEHHQSEIFVNLLVVVHNDKLAAFREILPTLMEQYYETQDANEQKRLRDQAKQKFNDIIANHKKIEDAIDKANKAYEHAIEEKAAAIRKKNLEEEKTNAGAAQTKKLIEEERKDGKKTIEEEKRDEQIEKLKAQDVEYEKLLEVQIQTNLDKADPRDAQLANESEEYKLFINTEHYLKKEGQERLTKSKLQRMPMALAPILKDIGIEDREGNRVYHTVVHKPQIEDVIKATRKAGVVAKQFTYNREEWEREKVELTTLKESFENKRKHVNQLSTDVFQDCMIALMHLKVIRAYIEGVLRFGIEKKFMIGLVCPRKGAERLILTQMNEALAETHLREYYGEKIDANENDDYWPFVCIPLTSPVHVFA